MSGYDYFTQLWPPQATLTEKTLPPQAGKVFAITGASAGVGYELARMLYAAGGKVYAFNRDAKKTAAAMQAIEKAAPSPATPGGSLVFIECDLNDLAAVARAAATFREQEPRLDVLFLNAGVAGRTATDTTAQGHEPQMGVNCLASFLLARLLTPALAATAKSAGASSVRVVWASSIKVDDGAPPGGVDMAVLTGASAPRSQGNYSASKAGNWLLAAEYHRRLGQQSGVVSVTQNPGNLKSGIWRNDSWAHYAMLYLFLWKPVLGAYTSLWAGFAPEVDLSHGGRYIIPWGRWHPHPRDDIAKSIRLKDGGGTGVAAEFWEWCEEQVTEWL